MKKAIIQTLLNNFESYSQRTKNGFEFWLARDLQYLLGYSKWDNFLNVISKAKTACEMSGHKIDDHFADVSKMVSIGSNAETKISDIILTRYACYLITQNGDPRKEEIAFAQTYFAIQTRKLEIIEKRLLESERISARRKLAQTEKELSGVIFEQTGSDKNFGIIRSKGDLALFGYSTKEMKKKWKIRNSRALSDFAPTIILKAKDFATEITIFNAKEKKMKSEQQISNEHITNNKSVRKTLLERGIRPEILSPEEDIQKVERKLILQNKKEIKNPLPLNKNN
jgi:DNA-damage-inducible protein D